VRFTNNITNNIGFIMSARRFRNWKTNFAALSRAARIRRIGSMRWFGGITDLLLGGFKEVTSFHVPITGPSRSEWIAAQGFGGPGVGLPNSWVDGTGDPMAKPGGASFGEVADRPNK
jgi:hypothetical protein